MPGFKFLDLGCAPGGFSSYLLEDPRRIRPVERRSVGGGRCDPGESGAPPEIEGTRDRPEKDNKIQKTRITTNPFPKQSIGFHGFHAHRHGMRYAALALEVCHGLRGYFALHAGRLSNA